jgi:hypothetical protein
LGWGPSTRGKADSTPSGISISHPAPLQILIVAALVDLVIALASGERGFGAFVEPSVIMLILIANGGCWD